MTSPREFTGKFHLDQDNPEAYESHLESMHYGEAVRLASKQLEIEMDVVFTDFAYTCFQKTQVGHTRRSLKLNTTVTEFSQEFPKRRDVIVRVTGPGNIDVRTEFEGGILESEWRVTERDERNKTITKFEVVSTLSLKDKDGNITSQKKTTRGYTRIDDVSPEILEQHNRFEQSGESGEITRVTPSSLRQQRDKEEKKTRKQQGLSVSK